MDRRLPRDEDGLAPDRRLTMAVGTGDGAPGRRSDRLAAGEPGVVERRVFVLATPRTVWATLHDPAATSMLFPEVRLGPASPSWPAAATTRSARAQVGLLRDEARVESLEARPDSRFRLRVTASGFDSEWSWRLEPVSGGTRVIHAATFEPFDRWTGILVRLGRASLASRVETHLRLLKEQAEVAQRAIDQSR
ncbi:MAG: SRPBCC family protein [Thermomicrobiales bacterium]|nr:MAG: SRPBCC family protein [Thermomicrobiales bacterium]